MHVEAVREQQAGALGDVGFDRFAVEPRLHHVRRQHRDQLGARDRFRRRLHGEAVGLRLGFGRAARTQADGDLEAGFAQVQRMRAALAAVTDDGDARAGLRGGLGVGLGHGGGSLE